MSPDLMWLFPLGIGLIIGAALMLGGLAFWAEARSMPWMVGATGPPGPQGPQGNLALVAWKGYRP